MNIITCKNPRRGFIKQEFWWKDILKNKNMGLIKEPEGVDFLIQSPPLTDKERMEISEFIHARKLEKKKPKVTV